GFPARRRQELAESARADGDDIGNAWADGIVASVADYIGWFARREAYRAAYRDFFKQWDILLAPVTMVNAFPHNYDLPVGARTLEVNGSPVPYSLIPTYAGLCNLSGQPGTAFPLRGALKHRFTDSTDDTDDDPERRVCEVKCGRGSGGPFYPRFCRILF